MEVIEMAWKTKKIVSGADDAVELVEKYCGDDTARVIRDKLVDLKSTNEYLTKENKRLSTEVESVQESWRDDLFEVVDMLDELLKWIDSSKRLNRDELQKRVTNIRRKANEEL